MRSELLMMVGEGFLGLLLNETRRRIIKLLKNRKMTITQIAKSLNLHTCDVVYHLHALETAGIVESKFEETAPKRFAKFFYINEEKLKEALESVEALIHEIRKEVEES